jgi:hypothetical protein
VFFFFRVSFKIKKQLYWQNRIQQKRGTVIVEPCFFDIRHSIKKNSDVHEFKIRLERRKLIKITVIPTRAIKRISLSGSVIFHDWKDRIRQHILLTGKRLITSANNEWANTNKENNKHYYDITREQNYLFIIIIHGKFTTTRPYCLFHIVHDLLRVWVWVYEYYIYRWPTQPGFL